MIKHLPGKTVDEIKNVHPKIKIFSDKLSSENKMIFMGLLETAWKVGACNGDFNDFLEDLGVKAKECQKGVIKMMMEMYVKKYYK